MAAERKIIHVFASIDPGPDIPNDMEPSLFPFCDLMDALLEVLERDPHYPVIHLRGGAAVLKPYLLARRDQQERIEHALQGHRLRLDAWYDEPGAWVASGETWVRNLLLGRAVIQKYGGAPPVPTLFHARNIPPQLPQLLAGFGYDAVVTDSPATASGPAYRYASDGSRVLFVHLDPGDDASFYTSVYRMVRFGEGADERRHTLERETCPLRAAEEGTVSGAYFLAAPRVVQWNQNALPSLLLRWIQDQAKKHHTSQIPCFLGYQGVHPDPRLGEIIQLCQGVLPDHEFIASNLNQYLGALRDELAGRSDTPELARPGSGEWGLEGADGLSAFARFNHLYEGSETSLARLAEPWGAIAAMLGTPYPARDLHQAWTMLLTSPSKFIRSRELAPGYAAAVDRAGRVKDWCHALHARSTSAIQAHIDTGDLAANDSVLTVFNPSPFPRNGIIDAWLDVPKEGGGFRLQTPEGEAVRVQTGESYTTSTFVYSPLDMPHELPVRRVRCRIETRAIPPLGYKTFHIARTAARDKGGDNLATAATVLENDLLRVVIDGNGTLGITHKPSRHTFEGLHYFSDSGEAGDEHGHLPPDENTVITSHRALEDLTLEESGPLVARVSLTYLMRFPHRTQFEHNWGAPHPARSRRSPERSPVRIVSRLELRKGSPWLAIQTRLENTCRDHRLQVVFPTGLKTSHTAAAAPFDVSAHAIDDNGANGTGPPRDHRLPMHGFVDVSDGKVGLAILAPGLFEYEAPDRRDRPVSLTLFRAHAHRYELPVGHWHRTDEDAGQAQGNHMWTYAIMPHTGDWTKGVLQAAEEFALPMTPIQAAAHQGILPKAMSFLEIRGANLSLAAFKRSEAHPDSMVMRLFNPTERTIAGSIILHRPIVRAWRVDLKEERLEPLSPNGNVLRVSVPRKAVWSIELQA